MPFPLIPVIGMGLSALGGLFGNKKQTQTTTQTLDPAFSPLRNMLLKQTMARLSAPSALPEGYEAGQIANINNTYNRVAQASNNNLTARGLATSPVAGVVDTNRDLARAGDITTMQASLPLLDRQLRMEDMLNAQGLLGLGRGGETTTSGNPAGGAFSSLATMLGYMYGKGGLGGNGNGVTLPGLSWSAPV